VSMVFYGSGVGCSIMGMLGRFDNSLGL
jgi:hypothetical protein